MQYGSAVVVCGLCCAVLLATVGVPLPVRVAKDRSTPFPCQDRPCGCASAERCWKSCCCFTNEQKVAWANKQGVKLPDYVLVAAQKEAAPAKAARACCQRGGACESKATTPKSEPSAAIEPKAPAETFELLLASSYRECQGLELLWTLLSQAVVVDAQPIVLATPAPGEWLAVFSEPAHPGVSFLRLRPPRGVEIVTA